MTITIFIRQRRKVEEGEKKPRFRVVAVSGGDLKFLASHVRRQEIDQIAAAVGGQVFVLNDLGDGSGKHQKP
ncbi:MAG: hypothetical protein RBR20_03480 [Desulfobacterales bacterium]|jgi:hypothetical protein|nr:hypothetical protein [Desulfobacteraceae bacterium]MDD3991660.1 hypothetical protein [Desulfobacteraceae bacterium]MDY0311164.1 hypothetical protein [Desulfobacterales bacterium]